MATYAAIANLAASKLGETDQLISRDDDTALGRAVRAVWDQERRAALRDHSWNFAMRRAELAATVVATGVPYSYANSFHLPADCLRLIERIDGCDADDWQIEGKAVLANTVGPVRIRYIADVDEPALWDDLFVEAFACRLAYQLADRLTGSESRRNAMWQAYRMALVEAKRVDARENPRFVEAPTGWELARYGGDGCGPPYRIPLGYPT